MEEIDSDGTNPEACWPSVDECRPDEEGGPSARAGFNYQDQIAAGFLIEMLEDPTLLKVHCETHDDIVLVRKVNPLLAEYVQVKALEQDKLWSVADLCQCKKGPGSSIFERSLQRDKCKEISRFRIVTIRPVVSTLRILTHSLDAPCRDGEKPLASLCAHLEKRFPGIKSPKGNGPKFWLKNCCWDERESEQAVRKSNLLRLIWLGGKEKKYLLPEAADVLLLELLKFAKSAGDAKWDPDPPRKSFRVRQCACCGSGALPGR